MVMSTPVGQTATADIVNTTSPFKITPQTTLYVVNGSVSTLTWTIKDEVYAWDIKLVTKQYDLYPIYQPLDEFPLMHGEEYNVTIIKEDDSPNVTTVILRLMHNENTWQHVPYVFCKLVRYINGSPIVQRSNNTTFFRLQMPTTTTSTEQTTQSSTGSSTTPMIDSTDINHIETTSISSERRLNSDMALLCTFSTVCLVNILRSWMI